MIDLADWNFTVYVNEALHTAGVLSADAARAKLDVKTFIGQFFEVYLLFGSPDILERVGDRLVL